ncbi:hypothetical protein AVEN_207277-1 [Araneus ventricosus]|uniref:Uncharacterized protein n=1 Tax=Araneus ventricosus TaxID=182803 RepID=A0A4Y2ICH9_ARAVE|nr:hypothetical protein AVEN_207277-1 [Araneus ventricosus]
MLNRRRRFQFETRFHQRSVLCLSQVHVKSEVEVFQIRNLISSEIPLCGARCMSNLTSKVPDSKPDFIRDPSYMVPGSRFETRFHQRSVRIGQVHVKSDVEGSRFETDFIRDPLNWSQVHVKSEVEGFQIRNPISSEIRLVLSQVHVQSDVEGSRFETRFHRDPSYMVPVHVKSDVEGSRFET